ncbi:hypothetical protein Cgig2_021372 [Carnegiea gigantea]|uniref:Uncharacterized protein n=1 Tax=Carnegiea gigantea TaxID=171969 RepID=A0A9Q1KCU1_9CARY|nr:hypothetical protein Cgig2_021372 [Carnegiea gigantea]
MPTSGGTKVGKARERGEGVMASKDCNSVPIDVDSNGEEVNVVEVEVDSRHARNTTTLRTGSYKPLADALTPVEEMNVDDLCGDVMKLHLDDGGDGEVTSKFSSGSGTTPKSVLAFPSSTDETILSVPSTHNSVPLFRITMKEVEKASYTYLFPRSKGT